MSKDTYGYVHPFESRTISVRETARIQTFPDWFRFGSVGLVDAYRIIGNAVPPLLSFRFAERILQVLCYAEAGPCAGTEDRRPPAPVERPAPVVTSSRVGDVAAAKSGAPLGSRGP
jgi:hypothetical protein